MMVCNETLCSGEESEFHLLYEQNEILGDGISSVVRRCVHKETGQEFAVKVIDKFCRRTEDVKGIDCVSQFHKEVAVLSKLTQHPHIIKLKDSFESSAFMFLVLELAKGGELFDYLTKEVTIPEKLARRFMYQLLHAVKHIHDSNIVHRDIKPENILLDGDKNIILSDFGFGVILEPGQELRETVGTPSYFAPEVLKCLLDNDAPGYGTQVDLWSCGVILYTLLVGQGPFWHRKDTIMYRKIMAGDYRFHSPEWDDISEAPKDLIRQLLVVNPRQRFDADEALAHPWFESIYVPPALMKTKPKRRLRFKVVAHAVVVMKHLYYTYHQRHAPPTYRAVSRDPYSFRSVRKVIDSCAFNVYGHWVKRTPDEVQNRGALFANSCKKDFVSQDTTDGKTPVVIPTLYSDELTKSFIPRKLSFVRSSSAASLEQYVKERNAHSQSEASSPQRASGFLLGGKLLPSS